MAQTNPSPPRCFTPPRVCLVTETYPPDVNGVAMTLAHLVDGLRAREFPLLLIRPRQSGDGERTDPWLVTVPGLPLPFYKDVRLGLAARGRLEGIFKAFAADVVHIATEGPLGLAALRAARRLGLPVTSSFHTNFHRYSRYYGVGLLARPIAAYLRRFHNRCVCTLAPTRAMAAELGAMGFDRCRVLARGVDTALFDPARRDDRLRSSWGAGTGDTVVLYVGRLAAEKNLDLAVQAFLAVRERAPTARFVLVGDGPSATSLKRHHPDFVFAGMRRDLDLARHYASADLFVFPSLSETFGNVTQEAMASGLAVVAFDYAAAHERIVCGNNGITVPVGDRDAFVHALVRLACQPDEARRLGSRAREAMSGLDWADIDGGFAGVLREAAVSRREAAGNEQNA